MLAAGSTRVCDMRLSFVVSLLLLPVITATLVWPGFTTNLAAGEKEDAGKTRDITIAVVDFDYLDTSGEARDQRQEHEARLKAFMTALRSDLAAHGKTIVSLTCDPAPCSVRTPPADLLRAARAANAGIVLVGSIQKMSTLVQWAKAEAIDSATERMVLDKLFTFRGDNDESWRRAEVFIANQLAGIERTSDR
jgi:hypothetical protein